MVWRPRGNNNCARYTPWPKIWAKVITGYNETDIECLDTPPQGCKPVYGSMCLVQEYMHVVHFVWTLTSEE